jgi:hypothetical protein
MITWISFILFLMMGSLYRIANALDLIASVWQRHGDTYLTEEQ